MDDFSHDGQRFFREGEYLYNVFSVSATDYFKLLTGIGESPELLRKYLHMTNYWSAGDLILINDSKNVIRIHSLVHFFSGGNRLIHVAVFSFFSFFLLIGWTTPVVGAITRYRFPAQLIIIVCCLLLIDTSKWKKNMS